MSGQLQMSARLKHEASANPPVAASQLVSEAPILAQLVELVSRPVTDADRERALLHVMDWLGCAAAGATLPQARGFGALAATGGFGACATIGGARTDWWHALQANAAFGNLLEMDDLHRSSILHPGPVIVPAAIAVAEQVGADGANLLDAIIRGYEATIRVGRALGQPHYYYFHNTSTAGCFGAAAATAALLGLDATQTCHALANAGSRTGGLWQMRFEDCESKSLHNVQAAQTGVQAALLAQQGVRGPATLLEGERGLFAAMSERARATEVIVDADAPWAIHDVSFKPWPACRHAHPTIDAALALHPRIQGRTIARVEVTTYKAALDFCDRMQPTTSLQAKFSLQHCVAVCLTRGAPWLADFEATAIDDAVIAALRTRVVVNEAPGLTQRFPQHYSARVTVHLDDGTQLSHAQDDALGDPECPLTSAEIARKALQLLEFAGWEKAAQLLALVPLLPTATSANVRAFTSLWQGRA